MTQQERDMMVERYIDGNMSQSERHEFLDLLDSDEKMRQTLRAETAINNAIKIDRTATTMPSAASRERFLTMLATVAPEGAAPVGSSPQNPGAGAAGKGAMASKGILGSSVGKVIVSAIAGVAVTVGAVVLVPKLVESPTPAAVPPAVVAPQQPGSAPQLTSEPAPVETAPPTTGGTATTIEPRTPAPAARKRSTTAEIERKEEASQVKKSTVAEHEQSSEGTKQEDPKVINGKTDGKLKVHDPVVNQ